MSNGNGNNSQVKRILITGVVAALIGAIGWIFIQVRDLPANYVPRGEVEKRLERIEEKVDYLIMRGEKRPENLY